MLKHPSGGAADPCAAARAQMFAACDRELDTAATHALDVHLAACEACRAHFVADATFHRVIRGAAALDAAPASLRERILATLHARTTENAPA